MGLTALPAPWGPPFTAVLKQSPEFSLGGSHASSRPRWHHSQVGTQPRKPGARAAPTRKQRRASAACGGGGRRPKTHSSRGGQTQGRATRQHSLEQGTAGEGPLWVGGRAGSAGAAARPCLPRPHGCPPCKAPVMQRPSPAAGLLRSSLKGSPCHLPQVALPRELTHRAPWLEPELNTRSQHAVTCTLHPKGTAPRTGAWLFSDGCCLPPASSHEKPEALGLPPSTIRKPHGSSMPCTPPEADRRWPPVPGPAGSVGLTPCPTGHHSHHTENHQQSWPVEPGDGKGPRPAPGRPLPSCQARNLPQPPPPSYSSQWLAAPAPMADHPRHISASGSQLSSLSHSHEEGPQAPWLGDVIQNHLLLGSPPPSRAPRPGQALPPGGSVPQSRSHRS